MDTIGCGTAIVTPFRADGSIDERALRALVNWQIESGIDFLVACGSTGEAATLEEDEWLATIRIVLDAAAGRVPVWAGCTHNSTRVLLRQAALLRPIKGLTAVLSANPYYNKPTQEGQFQHFLALAKAVDPLPVCLYNVPGRTAANLEPEDTVDLLVASGEKQDRRLRGFPDLPADFQSVHLRHADVENDEIVDVAVELAQRLLAILRDRNIHAGFLEGKAHDIPDMRVIVDDKNGRRHMR